MNPKINAYFIIFLLLFSMFPIQVPIASATEPIIDSNGFEYTYAEGGKYKISKEGSSTHLGFALSGVYNGNFIIRSFNNFTWNTPFESSTGVYDVIDISGNWKTQFDFTSDVKITNEITNSYPLPITNAKFYYVMSVDVGDKIRIGKEVRTVFSNSNYHFTNNNYSLNKIVPQMVVNNIGLNYQDLLDTGFNITDLYLRDGDILGYPNQKIIAVGFTKGNSILDSGQTVVIDPTIENGFTGTTTTTLTGLSGNQSISVPDGSSYDLNITNNQVSAWVSTDGKSYTNKSVITINGSMVTTETEMPLQLFTNLEGVNGTGDIGIAYTNLTAIPREIEYIWDSDNVSVYSPYNIVSGVDSQFIILWSTDNNTEPDADSTYGSRAVWSGYEAVWLMNENPTGTTTDRTGNDHNGTSSGFIADDLLNSTYGKKINFDGADAHIDMNRITELEGVSETWTVGTYAAFDVAAANNLLFGYNADGTIGAGDIYTHYASATSTIKFGVGAGEVDTTISDVSDTEMHFMTFGHTATNAVVYEDGVNKYDAAKGGTAASASHVFKLGENYNVAYLNGKIGFAYIHPDALSGNYATTQYKNLNNPTAVGTDPFYLSIGETQTASGIVNITASITGDSNKQSYNTSQSREFTLTPTGETNNILVNTTSTDYNIAVTTYWTDDTTLISQSASQGTALMFLNYTSNFGINSGVINSTFSTGTIDFSAVDSVGVIKATQNDVNYTSNASRTGQDINVSVTNLTADQSYLYNFSILYNKNMTASVSEQSFSTTQDVSVVFTASDEDSNPLTISGILNGTTKTTTSPHNYGKLSAGTYTYYLNVTEDATINPHTENLTATINVIQNYGSVPSIHDGVYGYHYDTIPSESQILSRQSDGLVTVDIPIDFDNLNASVWDTVKSRISYAYDENIRISLHLDMHGAYTSQSYINGIKSNVSTYLSDLIGDPYQSNTQFLTLNFTNTSAIESEKVSFANTIGVNISDSTNSKFKSITREQLTGLDATWVDNTPIKYIDLTTKSQWIDDEASNYRAATTKSRMYTGNTSFFDDITTYRNTQLMKARGSSDVGNQFSETSTVKLTNGDIILYNNASSVQNTTIQNVDSGTYFDINNDVYFNLTSNGEIYFNAGAESIIYVLKDTFNRIVFEDNTTSELKKASVDGFNIIDYGNTLNETVNETYGWGGENSDLKFEFYDPYYTEDNTFMIHYEWLNSSVVTDYSPYDYIIVADQNANEINDSFSTTNNLYGYIAVSDYADNQAWYDSKIEEVDAWVDVYDTNIFIDGIDFSVSIANFSSRFKDVVNYIRVDKNKEAIINTYTAYENFSTYGDMVMKESCFSRWGGTVGNPTYSYENMTIEKERADFYNSHNIPALGMSFGAVDDYEKQAFTSFAFAVLYGFDGENSWRYGQPNFQSQVELSIYPFGTMLEDTYTEHSSTDWSRLYSSGRVHINPIDHTYSIDNNLYVNSIKFNMSLYSGAEGTGDRNVYVYVNDNTTPYTIPYNAGVDPVGSWTDKQLEISTSEYNTTGHYTIYAYTLRSGTGGWNFIGERDITGIGTHTWYENTAFNIPDNYTGQTWTALQSDRNFMVSLSTNVTTSIVLDDIENKITQTNIDTTYNITTVVNSTEDYDIPFWSDVVTITNTLTEPSTYFKAQNGTWVEASINTVVDASADVIDWAYTTIDNKVYGVVNQIVSATEYVYRYLFPEITSSQEVYTESNPEPTVELLSQTPSTIHMNSTGYMNISYGITHDSSGLNSSNVAFIYRNYDHDLSDSNHSIRVPENNKSATWNLDGQILRGANRNETLNFENNDTITGGDIYSWSGLDENNTRLTIVPINDTYTLVHINGTIHDLMPQMWYLDRSDLQAAPKTQMGIHKSQDVLIKFWNFEIFKDNYDFIGAGYTDTSLEESPSLQPSDADPLEFYYINSSYDPATGGDPLTSGYAVYMGSSNTTEWLDYVYEPHANSSYVRGFIDNSLLHTYIQTTEISYLYFKSNTPSSKPYYISVTDVESSTNVSFADTNVLWAGDTAPYTAQSYTPNVWFAFMKANMSFDHQLYVADTGDKWANSTISRTTITEATFPPTKPFFNAFHFNGDSDYDMNGTYSYIDSMCVGVSTDPDGGNVTHNVTLHYSNKTYLDTLNNTLIDKDIAHNGIYAHVDFNVTPYYSSIYEYTLRIVATDDEGSSQTVWLNSNFTLRTPNYDNFTFTNAQVSPSAILEGNPFTVSVDINDTDGTIATAIVKIDGTNYTMTNSTGDTWIYTFTNTAISTRYYVQNFYAQDNTSAWNSTTSTLSVMALPTTGTGGFGGIPTDIPEPVSEPEPPEEELIPEEPTDIGSIFDVLEEKLSEATNITTIKNIFKSKAVAFVGVKYTVGDYSTTKDIVKPEALTCESTDPRVSCGVMDGVVTIIVMPTTDDSKLYQFTDTYVKITNNDLNVYHLPISLYLINLMWYFDFNMDTGIENPYIVAYDASGSFTIGLRLWWIGLSFGLLLLLFGLNRKYGGKLT